MKTDLSVHENLRLSHVMQYYIILSLMFFLMT